MEFVTRDDTKAESALSEEVKIFVLVAFVIVPFVAVRSVNAAVKADNRLAKKFVDVAFVRVALVAFKFVALAVSAFVVEA